MSLTLSVGLRRKLETALNRTGWTAEQVDRVCQGDMLKSIRTDYLTGVKLYRQRPTTIYVTEGDNKTPEELIKVGNYFYVSESLVEHIKSDQFRMSPVFQDVEIELLEFSESVNISDIRAYFARNDYTQATTEDAMRIGARYSNEILRTDNAILFTALPWVDRYGRASLTALWATDHRNRTLTNCEYGGPFQPGTVVAARKRIFKRDKC